MPRKSKKEIEAHEPVQEEEAFSESYLSMGLGLLVVLVVGVLLFNFFTRGKNQEQTDTENTEENQAEQNEAPTADTSGSYTVVEGDTLWSIAEDNYNSGYEWERIAQENSLANPDNLEAGQKLTLPKMQNEVLPETGISSDQINDTTYVVKENDTLWDIACRAYTDCYRWVDIVHANSLPSPDYIETGSELTIPR